MDLLNVILSQGKGQAVRQLASNFGLNESQALAALSNLLPVLGQGLARNASTQGGLDSLLGALAGGKHQRYLEDPSILNQEDSINDGNGILGHILGNKEASRQLAQQAAERTGIGPEVLKKMLPMVATLAMGALSRQTAGAQSTPGAKAAEGLTGMLGQFLDKDGDGSIADDILGMASRFLK
ncbi:MAG: DUF937 domain-containing protein [Acidobacteriota bacterium]|nr:DUF937 domain-containing protein [Acidobacteriota bacterium]